MNLKSFNKIWPVIGGGIALIIVIVVALLWNNRPTTSQLTLLFWVNLALLMFHEFEEYVIPGGFKHFINHKTILGISKPEDKEPISDIIIVIINIGAWMIFITAVFMSEIAPWLGVGMILFNVVNILGHLIIFQKKVKGYNPGLVTAILMVPFLVFAFIFVINHQILDTEGYILAFLFGIITGGSLPIIGIIIKKKATGN